MLDDFKFPNSEISDILLFVKEAGKLKSVIRQTLLHPEGRFENSAEHSWHLILMAICLKNHSNEKINIERVVKMLAVHDLGEVYHGDTFLYDVERSGASAQEKQALIKLLGNIPKTLKEEIIDLWVEFEARETPEAKYAQGLDRFQPFMEQLDNGGESWLRNNISHEKALAKNAHINDGSNALWELYEDLSAQAENKNMFYKN